MRRTDGHEGRAERKKANSWPSKASVLFAVAVIAASAFEAGLTLWASFANPVRKDLLSWRNGERPRQDSNLRHRLRRPVLYPLSYGGGRSLVSAHEQGTMVLLGHESGSGRHGS